jgi:Peptidase_C39 like family
VLNVVSIVCRMLSRKTLGVALIALVAVGGLGYSGYRVWRHYFATEASPPAPKTAVVIAAPSDTPTAPPATAAPTPVPTLPPSVFIKVPYTSEFPFRQFGDKDPHQNYCEAAALEMISQYFKGDTRDLLPPAEADAGMGGIVSTERKEFPGVLDLPLTSVAAVGTQLFGLKPTIVPVDLGEIERNLAAGRPVIVPIMTWVGNTKLSDHYGTPAVYHVLVLTGYDSAKGLIYTNESGFVEGHNWTYTWNTISAAIDAQAAKFPQGRVMLVFDKS